MRELDIFCGRCDVLMANFTSFMVDSDEVDVM